MDNFPKQILVTLNEKGKPKQWTCLLCKDHEQSASAVLEHMKTHQEWGEKLHMTVTVHVKYFKDAIWNDGTPVLFTYQYDSVENESHKENSQDLRNEPTQTPEEKRQELHLTTNQDEIHSSDEECNTVNDYDVVDMSNIQESTAALVDINCGSDDANAVDMLHIQQITAASVDINCGNNDTNTVHMSHIQRITGTSMDDNSGNTVQEPHPEVLVSNLSIRNNKADGVNLCGNKVVIKPDRDVGRVSMPSTTDAIDSPRKVTTCRKRAKIRNEVAALHNRPVCKKRKVDSRNETNENKKKKSESSRLASCTKQTAADSPVDDVNTDDSDDQTLGDIGAVTELCEVGSSTGIQESKDLFSKTESLELDTQNNSEKLKDLVAGITLQDNMPAEKSIQNDCKYSKFVKLAAQNNIEKSKHLVSGITSKHMPSGRGMQNNDCEHAKIFYCNICDFKSRYRSALARHKKTHGKKLQCDRCDRQFSSNYDLKCHVRIEHEKKYLVCDLCQKEFKTRGGLKGHERYTHGGAYSLKCAHCNHKGFRSKIHLQGHIQKEHFGTSQYSCKTCDKTFVYKWHMTTHALKCNGPRKKETGPPFKCRFCDKEFTTKSTLAVHVRGKHSENARQYVCKCGKSYRWASSFCKHKNKCSVSKEVIEEKNVL